MITNRVNRAEVQEQRSKHDQACAAQKGDRQIEIFVRSDWCVKVKDEGRHAKRCEMQHEGRSPALFKDYEQAHEQIDNAD